MRVGQARMKALWAVVFSIVATSGCSGGCSQLAPLPAPIPLDQTIEGGVQIRVTPSGFATLTSIVPSLVNDMLVDGFCIGRQGPWDVGIADVDACYQNDCAGGAQGCRVNFTLDSLVMSIPDDQTFRIDTQFDVYVPVDVRADWIIGGDSTCTFDVTLDNGRVIADIAFGIDPATGELTVELAGIQTFDISGFGMDGCGVLGDILGSVIGLVADILSSSIGNFLIDALTPVIDGFIQDMLPKPLGLEGVLDLGSFMAGLAPGVEAKLETRAVAGGYVSLPSQGLSVGMIVGLNADRDPATRDAETDSQASFCVPDRPAPDFTGVLPPSPRGSFALQPAGEFMGVPDPAADLALGVSETVLDLSGHHIVSSGAMCLGVGSSLVSQLNLGTIGILVPSLAELGAGTGKEPILLVLRPQQPLDFTIGDGTEESPRLTIHIRDMEVDFYAFLMERYVRGFTLVLNMDAGLNLDFVLDDMGQPAIMPTILGVDAESIGIQVINAEFLREDPAALEAVFPTLFDLILPLLSEGLGAIALPEISGFTLDNLQFTKVVTPEDDFLAIYASLGVGSGKRAQIEKGKKWLPGGKVPHEITAYEPVETEARVVRVTTPAAETIRAALLGEPGGALPEIELELGGRGLPGQTLEWQWRLDGGMWHPYAADARPVLGGEEFVLQGRHLIEVRARAVGDYRTFDTTPVELPVVIDSVAPVFLLDETVNDGDALVFAASDLVTDEAALEFAFGDRPWQKGGRLPLGELSALAAETGTLTVAVRDELGNTATADVDVSTLIAFHGRVPASGDGCGCHVATRAHDHNGGLVAGIFGVLFVLALGLRRRVWAVARKSRRALPWLALVLVAGFAPGCDCSGNPGGVKDCVLDEDCAAQCGEGKIPLCANGECFCADDIPIGIIGSYSDIAAATDGRSYVSAYNQTHGDLMVAEVLSSGRIPLDDWEFVDGVPDGPVVLPQSDVRGGIREAGDDVGIYTSIAVTAQNEPVVSYFDKTTGSLRFAGRFSGDWRTMEVDKGAPIQDIELGGEEAGRYSSVSVSLADGRPAIAYMATVMEGNNIGHTELRFAQAVVPQPSSTADWNLWIVDQAPLPPIPEGEAPPTDVPDGIGLFVASARRPDGSPVLAYYDRVNGDLKIAYFDVANNAFLPPEVVDGADGADVGWYPSVWVSPDDVVHLSYVDAVRDNLLYMNLTDRVPEVIDDGYRIDGMTSDGLPKPVYHFVGDDSGIVVTGAFMAVAYQDATAHELLLATRQADGTWARTVIAGAEDPFAGGYGFYASADFAGEDMVMSSYVMDQGEYDYWVEVFRQPIIVE